MTDTKQSGPIEVWLTQKNLEITCTEVHEDETTSNPEVDSLSMRGAQREMTGFYLRMGYEPLGRWTVWVNEDGEALDDNGPPAECSRRFRPVRQS